MIFPDSQKLITVTTESRLPSWLAEWCRRCGAEVLDQPAGPATLAIVLRRHPRLVVLHAGASAQVAPCATWIHELHKRRPRLSLVALADNHHDDQFERALRSAGADYYVCGEPELNTVVGAVLASTDVAEPSRSAPPELGRGRSPPSRDSPLRETPAAPSAARNPRRRFA